MALSERDKLFAEGKQRCTKCNRVKGLHLFHKINNNKYGVRTVCKACAKKSTSAKQKHHNHVLRTYGITGDEYLALAEKNDNRCWICGRGSTVRLAVDHNHKTGKVRGLLCKPCNRMLGLWGDRPEVGERAAEYLGLDGSEVDAILGRVHKVPTETGGSN